MKYREKLGYIALGGFLMLVGMLTAALFAPLGAQNEKADLNVRDITCRSLKVAELVFCRGLAVDDFEGNMAVSVLPLSTGGQVFVHDTDGKMKAAMGVEEYGGSIAVFGDGESEAVMEMDEHGAMVSVQGKDGAPAASISAADNGGVVGVFGKNGALAVSISTDDNGGVVGVLGKGDTTNPRVGVVVSEYGNGEISTWDKNGNRLQ